MKKFTEEEILEKFITLEYNDFKQKKYIKNFNFYDCEFNNLNLDGIHFINCLFENINFIKNSMRFVQFSECKFINVTFLDCNMVVNEFTNSRLIDVNYINSNLDLSLFSGCSFKNLYFENISALALKFKFISQINTCWKNVNYKGICATRFFDYIEMGLGHITFMEEV